MVAKYGTFQEIDSKKSTNYNKLNVLLLLNLEFRISIYQYSSYHNFYYIF